MKKELNIGARISVISIAAAKKKKTVDLEMDNSAMKGNIPKEERTFEMEVLHQLSSLILKLI